MTVFDTSSFLLATEPTPHIPEYLSTTPSPSVQRWKREAHARRRRRGNTLCAQHLPQIAIDRLSFHLCAVFSYVRFAAQSRLFSDPAVRSHRRVSSPVTHLVRPLRRKRRSHRPPTSAHQSRQQCSWTDQTNKGAVSPPPCLPCKKTDRHPYALTGIDAVKDRKSLQLSPSAHQRISASSQSLLSSSLPSADSLSYPARQEDGDGVQAQKSTATNDLQAKNNPNNHRTTPNTLRLQFHCYNDRRKNMDISSVMKGL